ncbi:7-carboxy-7-deazaguanine synthase QueE [Pseudomonas sp. F1_0610]|uniref:7-carboxy-7-deazaguanine synthase QueE n=1 Tax=Pseudomonas sp. F1_0610 TaxID=3114284 RepID=UPI0039C0AF4C
MALRISEIFYSLQGEARTVGVPTLFIRLTGCPLRCQYCDTDYAFSGGKLMSLDEILSQVKRYNTAYICVTGGEPLAQPECLPLLTALCDQGLHVSLETSGAMDVAQVDPRVSKVMDLKTPASQEAGRNRYENLAYLTKHDQIKFVICNRHDYDWAVTQLIQYQLVDKVSDVLFSPSKEQLEARELADWIIADQLAVRLQVQLHKILWNDAQGR